MKLDPTKLPTADGPRLAALRRWRQHWPTRGSTAFFAACAGALLEGGDGSKSTRFLVEALGEKPTLLRGRSSPVGQAVLVVAQRASASASRALAPHIAKLFVAAPLRVDLVKAFEVLAAKGGFDERSAELLVVSVAEAVVQELALDAEVEMTLGNVAARLKSHGLARAAERLARFDLKSARAPSSSRTFAVPGGELCVVEQKDVLLGDSVVSMSVPEKVNLECRLGSATFHWGKPATWETFLEDSYTGLLAGSKLFFEGVSANDEAADELAGDFFKDCSVLRPARYGLGRDVPQGFGLNSSQTDFKVSRGFDARGEPVALQVQWEGEWPDAPSPSGVIDVPKAFAALVRAYPPEDVWVSKREGLKLLPVAGPTVPLRLRLNRTAWALIIVRAREWKVSEGQAAVVLAALQKAMEDEETW